MWYKAQSVGVRPNVLETNISQDYVFVRKDIIETINEDLVSVYDYYEQKITKSDWFLYSQLVANDSSMKDVVDAVLEITEIIGNV